MLKTANSRPRFCPFYFFGPKPSSRLDSQQNFDPGAQGYVENGQFPTPFLPVLLFFFTVMPDSQPGIIDLDSLDGHARPGAGLEEKVAFFIEFLLYFLVRATVSRSVWRGRCHDCM